MSQPPPKSRDVRLRPFRAAAYGLHMLLIVAFIGLVIVSVVKSVAAMTPDTPPPSESVLTVRECSDLAEGYWKELEEHRQALASRRPVKRASSDWSDFRLRWFDRVRETESRCALDSRSRERLSNAYRRLERLMELYTTHAVQYAGEIGGAVDNFYRALDDVREENRTAASGLEAGTRH